MVEPADDVPLGVVADGVVVDDVPGVVGSLTGLAAVSVPKVASAPEPEPLSHPERMSPARRAPARTRVNFAELFRIITFCLLFHS